MKRTWTVIGVRDVAANLRWYQSQNGLVLFFRVDDRLNPMRRSLSVASPEISEARVHCWPQAPRHSCFPI
jgi:hypothetical protein